MVSTSNLVLLGVIGLMISNGSINISTFFLLGLALCALFLVFLYSCQEQMLYQPKVYPQFTTPSQNPPGFRSPAEHALAYEDVRLTTRDGVRLHAWFLRPDAVVERRQRPTILFFHANAGNMGFRMENLRMMYRTLQANVFILSYRGYGESEGTPTETGLCEDAQACWDYLHKRDDVDVSRLFIFGRSLGGSVAIYLASRYSSEISGIIVENTFLSISSLADSLFPFLRLPYLKKYLLRLSWNAGERIAAVTCPILLLSGAVDEVVPPTHMQALFERATQAKFKKLEIFPTGQHNNTWTEGGIQYINVFLDFINQFAPASSSSSSAARFFTAAAEAVAAAPTPTNGSYSSSSPILSLSSSSSTKTASTSTTPTEAAAEATPLHDNVD